MYCHSCFILTQSLFILPADSSRREDGLGGRPRTIPSCNGPSGVTQLLHPSARFTRSKTTQAANTGSTAAAIMSPPSGAYS